MLFLMSFIFFHVEENESKEDARVQLFPARRRRVRSTRKLTRLRQAFGVLRQSARFDPAASPMLGAEQGEIQDQKPQTTLRNFL